MLVFIFVLNFNTNTMLYPLKFEPIFKEKLWGGEKLRLLNKNLSSSKIGESWELSGISEDFSRIVNGFLAKKNIIEILSIYKEKLVGNKIYKKFGNTFPLLIKFIHAADDLSVQVHPDDKLAMRRHSETGKNEMWYILEAEENAELILGFNKEITPESFALFVEKEELSSVLQKKRVKRGDLFYIPAGLVHSIGKGIVIAEIQQTSDLTYRIDDRNRIDANGMKRELHIELAKEAINFKNYSAEPIEYKKSADCKNLMLETPYFCANFINLQNKLKSDYSLHDSFIVYLCLSGEFSIEYSEGRLDLRKGDTVMIPDEISFAELKTNSFAEIMEVFI